MGEDKRKHLPYSQDVVKRMASNSFAVKGWSVALATGTLAYTAKDGVPETAYIALVPVLTLAALDAYYLQLERQCRRRYDEAARITEANVDFNLGPIQKPWDWVKALKSPSILLFHIPLLVLVAGVAAWGRRLTRPTVAPKDSKTVDATTEIQYLGPQWQAYTGLSNEEARGDTTKAIHPEDRERSDGAWRRALETGLPYEAEIRIRRADGEYRYFSARAEPIRDAQGRIVQWIGTTTDVHDMRAMRIALEERTRQLGRAYAETFERLVRAAALRDDDTANHTGRVGLLACRIALRLGYAKDDAAELSHAAELHDLGKIGIPDAILHKPGRLTDEERRLMETHTTLGASLLDRGESSLLRRATTVALSHHERWDGGGYPGGLAREAIPLDGRIVAVADAYDAMTSDRPYRDALPDEEARERLRAGRASQWDPEVIDAFLGLEHD